MGKASKVTYRFVTGHHLDGQHRTDARAFTRGTRIVHPSGRAGRWSHLSRAERSAWRLGTLALISSGTYGYVVAPAVTIDSLYTAGTAGAAFAAHRTRRAVRRRRHYREWVRPLHRSIAAAPSLASLGISTYSKPDTYLTVPVDYATNENAVIEMRLPADFSGGALKHEIERIIKDKLGLNDVIVTWRVAGHEPKVMIQIAPRPPKSVKWKDALELIEAAPESAPIIGVGTRGVTVAVDLNTEAPHVLVSASTGGGKSVIVRVIVSQLMHKGAHAIFLDAKRHSHRWARGLDNVDYCRSTEEIHNALVWAAAEGERRNVLVDDGGDDAIAQLPRIVIVAEEMNATINRLQDYWAAVRTKDDPKASPAVKALGEVLFMGRVVKMNVIAVAQMMTARTLGGPEARENFAVRILARYTPNAWNMLVPEIRPMPRSSRHAGRVQVCIAGGATETQVIFPSEKESREWASSGMAAAAPTGTVPASQGTGTQGNGGPSVVGQRGALTLVPEPQAPPELAGITLSQAVADGVVSVSLAIIRKESTRDPEFPDSIGKQGSANLYDPADLMAWQRNRPRAVG
jgi:Helicase HerA, central domain